MTGLLAQATLALLAGCSLAGRRLGAYRRWWRREHRAQAAWQAAVEPAWDELHGVAAVERRGRHSRHPDRVPAGRLIHRHGAAAAGNASPLYEALVPAERTAS